MKLILLLIWITASLSALETRINNNTPIYIPVANNVESTGLIFDGSQGNGFGESFINHIPSLSKMCEKSNSPQCLKFRGGRKFDEIIPN